MLPSGLRWRPQRSWRPAGAFSKPPLLHTPLLHSLATLQAVAVLVSSSHVPLEQGRRSKAQLAQQLVEGPGSLARYCITELACFLYVCR
jgi:hypothetical protein